MNTTTGTQKESGGVKEMAGKEESASCAGHGEQASLRSLLVSRKSSSAASLSSQRNSFNESPKSNYHSSPFYPSHRLGRDSGRKNNIRRERKREEKQNHIFSICDPRRCWRVIRFHLKNRHERDVTGGRVEERGDKKQRRAG